MLCSWYTGHEEEYLKIFINSLNLIIIMNDEKLAPATGSDHLRLLIEECYLVCFCSAVTTLRTTEQSERIEKVPWLTTSCPGVPSPELAL
jgi:hypothetical protein